MDKAILDLFAIHPSARKVENRYKALRWLLKDRFYSTFKDTNNEVMEAMLFDAITLDRKIRKLTEGEQDELKQQLSEEFQVEELGFQIGV